MDEEIIKNEGVVSVIWHPVKTIDDLPIVHTVYWITKESIRYKERFVGKAEFLEMELNSLPVYVWKQGDDIIPWDGNNVVRIVAWANHVAPRPYEG